MIDTPYARLAAAATTTRAGECALSHLDLGAGEPLLLIHGGHGGWYHWMRNVEAFAAHARVIAPDLPGFGRSTTPQREFSLAVAADELFALLDRLGIGETDIAAFSFGACVAAQMAVQSPQRVRSLAIVNPAGMGPVSARLADAQASASRAAKAEGLVAGVRVSLAQIMLSDAALVTPGLCRVVADHVRATRVLTRPIARSNPTRGLLERVRAPVWLALGSRDPHQAHELEARASFIEALSTRHAAALYPAAHWLPFEAAGWFNENLGAFLTRVRGGRLAPPSNEPGFFR